VDTVFPVIYPPQVAIVGFGRIVRRSWVVGEAVVPRRVVTAALAADHRVTDGHRAGRFLDALDRLLQEPAGL
jgi:pyruvate dehydrogenase E2 component (dihydrolipoamide acetyltransferase)